MPHTLDELLAAFALHPDRTLVLTANLRQSRFLRSQIADHFTSVFEMPKILTFDQWLSELWCSQSTDTGAMLADKVQEQWAWKQTLSAVTELPSLVDQKQLSKHLQDAEEISEWYGIPEKEIRDANQEECEFYLEMLPKKSKLIQQAGLISQHDAVKQLLNLPEEQRLRDTNIYLFGYVELPWLSETFIQGFSQSAQTLELSKVPKSVQHWRNVNQISEWSRAAHYVKATLEQKADQRIAIVIPTLSAQLSDINTFFGKYLEPQHYYLGQEDGPVEHVDISAGHTLQATSIVACATSLLSLFDTQIESTQLKTLLLSDYWHGESKEERIRLCSSLSRYQQERFSLSFIFDQAMKLGSKSKTTEFTALLASLRTQRREIGKNKSLQEWLNWFIKLLSICGWPSATPLSSRDFQYLQSFKNTLKKIEYDGRCFSQNYDFRAFKEFLGLRLQSAVAHIEVKKPKLQILGLLEAANLHFDEVLILGLEESTLPAPPKINPFLPSNSQITRQTPRSSHDREQRYASELLHSIVYASSKAILSYSLERDDTEQNQSPLLGQFYDLTTGGESGGSESYSSQFKTSIVDSISTKLSELMPGKAPPLPLGTSIRGSSNHLDLFKTNPMYAFFQYRLGIQVFTQTRHGMEASARGALLHSILNKVYQQNPNQDALKAHYGSAVFQDELKYLIEENVRDNPFLLRLPTSVIAYEMERMQKKISEFIELDLERTQAFKVAKLEESIESEIAGYKLKLIVDRIDDIENTSKLIIDYKTGSPSLSGIIKRDLREFQLPLYALVFSATGIDGVCYAEISKSKTRFLGLGAESIQITNIQPTYAPRGSELPEEFPATIQVWRLAIESCIEEIAAGNCAYLPLDKNKMRFYTHFERAVRQQEKVIAGAKS